MNLLNVYQEMKADNDKGTEFDQDEKGIAKQAPVLNNLQSQINSIQPLKKCSDLLNVNGASSTSTADQDLLIPAVGTMQQQLKPSTLASGVGVSTTSCHDFSSSLASHQSGQPQTIAMVNTGFQGGAQFVAPACFSAEQMSQQQIQIGMPPGLSSKPVPNQFKGKGQQLDAQRMKEPAQAAAMAQPFTTIINYFGTHGGKEQQHSRFPAVDEQSQ